MNIPQSAIKNNLLFKILQLLERKFPELFEKNSIGRPREYSLGKVLACMIYKARSQSVSFRKLEQALASDPIALNILGFKKAPNFSVICKIFNKYLKMNFNIYLRLIGISITDINEKTFYLDSSSLVTSKFDKEAGIGKSTRIGWYKGYKLHLICNRKGVPISFKLTTANVHDIHCRELVESLAQKVQDAEIIADKGYDSSKLLEYSNKLGARIIAPINKRKAKEIILSKIKDENRKENYIYLSSKEGQIRYRKRWEIERVFGNLKENYDIDNYRIRGFKRKYFNVSLKLLAFTIEKAIAVLKILQYFCNSLLI